MVKLVDADYPNLLLGFHVEIIKLLGTHDAVTVTVENLLALVLGSIWIEVFLDQIVFAGHQRLNISMNMVFFDSIRVQLLHLDVLAVELVLLEL